MTFTNELPEVLGYSLPFETVNILELVAEKLENGHLELAGMPAGTVLTYHDPCTLGRQLKIYDAPRQIIKAFPGARFVEMPRNRQDSYCCGVGSFVRYDFSGLTDSAGLQRWNEAVRTNAGTLLTSCISCLSEFQQVKSQTQDKMEVVDLISLINKQVRVIEIVTS
ncbi:MAG: (Fe-S)-binding protein, partial [Anaerolineaceae bacterium]|jgi:Fe-S oxidoreductase